MLIKENVILAPYTTFKIGGPARYFAEAKTVDDVIEAMQFAGEKKLPVFMLGKGSNILISDEGFKGLVILNKIYGIKHTRAGDKAVIAVGAGEDWHSFVDFAVSNNFAGVECLAGIPGSVGGAPIQNIGAYGHEAANVIREVAVYDTASNGVIRLQKSQCGFGYRKSIFNTEHPGRYVVLEVVFELEENGKPVLAYHDLKLHFQGRANPSLKDVHLAVLEIRAKKGMVIHPDFESYKSAGSFFKNPVVSKSIFEKIKEKIGGGDDKWFWPASPAGRDLPEDKVKISAAYLIERAGFNKGFREGDAGISPKHALSLINHGEAKAKDILHLAKKIIAGVKEKFGITLEPEAQLVGFEKNPFE